MAAREHTTITTRGPNPQEQTLIKLVRGVFLVLMVTFTAMIIVEDSTSEGGTGFDLVNGWYNAVIGALLFVGLFIAIDVLTPKRKLSTISAVFVGLIVGVVVTAILSLVLDLFQDIYELGDSSLLAPFKVMLGLGITYLTVTTVLQTRDDFRLVIPYVEFSKKIRGSRPYLLDTSALIDGRVLDMAEVGVFQAPLLVPRFVIEELQALSDSADKMKRARGRRGLDAVSALQQSAKVEVSIDESEAPGAGVDQKLVELSRQMPATVVTTDLGLVRVAGIEGASVLNLNDLANALKPVAIPGEPLRVTLLRRGEQPGQAVGYLPDGTMVVADSADHLIGSDADLTVTSTTQTSAGRLIFGKPANGVAPAPRNKPRAEPAPPASEPAPTPEPAPAATAEPAPAPKTPERNPKSSSPRNPRRA